MAAREQSNVQPSKIGVLLIAPPLKVVGGQSIQADRLCRHFREDASLRVTFQPTVVFFRFRYIRTIVNSLSYLRDLLRQIRKHDIVHIFTASYWSFLLIAAPALLISRMFKKHAILHYHDGRAFDHLRRWPFSLMLCRLAHTIVTPSGFLVKVFAHFGLQACAIANTLDTRAFPFRIRKNPGPIFLHTRGLEPEYNVACTLRAFSLIQKRCPEAQLTIANDGSLRRDLEQTVRSLGLRNVIFTGVVSQARIGELYDQADIYFSSADADNMPGSLLEAFAAGLPVIATRAGGTDWILFNGQNGLSVQCGDHAAMAKAAFRLLEEQGLAERLGSEARHDVESYSWDKVGWKWARLYSQIAFPTAQMNAEVECSSR